MMSLLSNIAGVILLLFVYALCFLGLFLTYILFDKVYLAFKGRAKEHRWYKDIDLDL